MALILNNKLSQPMRALYFPILNRRVYVEASLEEVRRICRDTHGTYRYSLVSVEDHEKLLQWEMNASRPVSLPQTGSWVVVRCGLYKRDLAYVLQSSDDDDFLKILVVPRVRTSSAKWRPKRALFYPKDLRTRFAKAKLNELPGGSI